MKVSSQCRKEVQQHLQTVVFFGTEQNLILEREDQDLHEQRTNNKIKMIKYVYDMLNHRRWNPFI